MIAHAPLPDLRLCLACCLTLLVHQPSEASPAKTITYYLTDQQGNVLATTDSDGNVTARFDYRPYGQPATAEKPEDQPGYAGHVEEAESTFAYMQARYDDLNVARFVSVDPLRTVPGDVFGFNRYAYASNNPVGNIDPNGMDDCSTSGDSKQTPCPPIPKPETPGPSPGDAVTLPVVPVTATTTSVRPLPRITIVPLPLIVAQAASAGLFFVDSNRFNELVFDHHSCYGSISCGTVPSNIVFNLPPGVWPADKGAEEWGRRNGIGKNEGRRRFHEIKQGDDAHSGGKADWGVNPETGDVYDPEGEVHGNLGD
jgi:RHS repeat-associated protein